MKAISSGKTIMKGHCERKNGVKKVEIGLVRLLGAICFFETESEELKVKSLQRRKRPGISSGISALFMQPCTHKCC